MKEKQSNIDKLISCRILIVLHVFILVGFSRERFTKEEARITDKDRRQIVFIRACKDIKLLTDQLTCVLVSTESVRR